MLYNSYITVILKYTPVITVIEQLYMLYSRYITIICVYNCYITYVTVI